MNMIYLSESHLRSMDINWIQVIEVINESVQVLYDGDYSQPIKPYLRYKNPKSRIIAMPAYVGGQIQKAGIKWIASFPENLAIGLPRAHSITILNDPFTGVPVGVLNASYASAVRTAAVSGLLVREFLKKRNSEKINVGITGFGPIGKLHVEMITALLGERAEIKVFEIKPMPSDGRLKIRFVGSWQEAFDDADIFITCTVAEARYIDRKPKKGSLQLNVSLRDYFPSVQQYITHIVVDDWEEVCRENTDIEVMHVTNNLEKSDTHSLINFIKSETMATVRAEDIIMFNPMGMAVFDISIGNYFLKMATNIKIGIEL